MTTLIAWMSRSGGGIRTLYLGADSLGTNLGNPLKSNNFVKKVFASQSTPEIFALSGNDVDAGAEFLRRIVKDISLERFENPVGMEDRVVEFSEHIAAKHVSDPTKYLEILYAARDGSDDKAIFKVCRILSPQDDRDCWKIEVIPETNFAEDQSVFLCAAGLGCKAYESRLRTLVRGPQGYAARQYFWALCDLIEGKPKSKILTGGVPQLAKLDQTGQGLLVGVNYYGRPFVAGSRVTDPGNRSSVWVNEMFESLNPATMQLWSGAQKYGRVRGSK